MRHNYIWLNLDHLYQVTLHLYLSPCSRIVAGKQTSVSVEVSFSNIGTEDALGLHLNVTNIPASVIKSLSIQREVSL